MTFYGDSQSDPTAALRTDGVQLAALTQPTVQQDSSILTSFWSSARRVITDTRSEVMEISFGSKRLINHLSFQLGRFPLSGRVEYLDDNGDWQAFTYTKTVTTTQSVLTGRKGHKRRKKVIRYLTQALQPIRPSIADSVPQKVDSAAVTSTQHFGKNHWVNYSSPVTPVSASKVRFVLRRNPAGRGPVDPHGRSVAYALAISNVQIGYRVLSTDDVPITPSQPEVDWWASSRDILGSRVVYSTYRQEAPAVIDGDSSTYWRSEPQPFPFAVVNLFLDVRDVDGNAPVIDRFWIDPVTVGPVCNVYYSDSDPVGEFDGLSEAIPDQWRTEVGNPTTTVDPSSAVTQSINLGPDTKTGFIASNAYLRIHYDQPWWVGVDARSLVSSDDPGSRPIVSMGSVRIVQEGGYLKVVAPTGEVAQIALDPTLHQANSRFRMIAAYFSRDEATHRDPYIRLVYRIGDHEPQTYEIAITGLLDQNIPVKIGLHPDPANTDVAAIGVSGLVVKSESLTPEAEEWFLDEGSEFVADATSPRLDRGTAQNARLRMHPMFRSPTTNLFGVVGGPGDRFDEMEWTPVTRDYTLRRGYLHLPPKRAKYWKFEMTRLVPQVYENFLTLDREALVFPPDVVESFNRLSGTKSDAKSATGVQTVANAPIDLSYSDALSRIEQQFAPDAASALVIKDPNLASEAARSGWIWTYQPWHVGSSAPQFVGTQVHRYEAIRVRHSTKIAFFAGVREITPYRVNYSFDDDTDEYVEHMLDDLYIDTLSGVELSEGSLTSIGASGAVTSDSLRSYRTVRGVQFATQETDAVQVLRDSDFLASDLSQWVKYGDATIDLLEPGNVLVNRGWFPNTWGMLEAKYPTWGDLDSTLYGALEGNDPITGYAEGGFYSLAYTPVGSGKITALAKVSSDELLSGPITLDIVSADDNRVLASATQRIEQGAVNTISVSYANTPIEDRTGGAVHHRTWGDLENSLGETMIPANGAVNVTAPGAVVGATPWDDDDDATYATSTSTSGGTNITAMVTDLPAAPMVPDRLTSVRMKIRSSVDDTSGVRGQVMIFDASSNRVAEGYVTLNDAATTQEVTLLAPTDTPTGSEDLGAAIQAGATVVVSLGPIGDDPMPVSDRTMTVYEFSLIAAADSTWGDLDNYRWGDLEAYSDEVIVDLLNPDLLVRIRQQGQFRDSFHVHRMALYESPISWYFSNDDGVTWWQAVDVRNDPHAVLMFPEITYPSPSPTAGKVLRWRAVFYRAGATVNALHIRPWYGTHSRTLDGAHTMEALGPNQSVYDNLPPIERHPMWTPIFNPIEKEFNEPEPLPPFWRNLVPTPSGESADAHFQTSGGTVTTEADWFAIVPIEATP